MGEENKSEKKIKIKSFNYKWYEFLVIYGIINISFFISINLVINNIYKNSSQLYVKDFIMDGSDLSALMNLFAVPLILFLAIISVGIFLLQEFIVILLFKYVYYIPTVKKEEISRLYQYIKIAFLCFILASITGIIFYGNLLRIILFVIIYLPIPFFVYILICLKMKRHIKEERLKAAEN